MKHPVFCTGDVSHEYDYVNGEYASLDMTKVGSQPTYQSLIGVERDLVRIFPACRSVIVRC